MLNLNRQVNITRCQAVEDSPLGQLTYESRVRDRRNLDATCGCPNDIQIVQASKCLVMDVIEQAFDDPRTGFGNGFLGGGDVHAADFCKCCSSDDAGIELTEGYPPIVKS